MCCDCTHAYWPRLLQALVTFLESQLPTPEARASALSKFQASRATSFLRACAQGDVGPVRAMLAAGCPPDVSDYDGRSGLEVAAARGHEVCHVFVIWSSVSAACVGLDGAPGRQHAPTHLAAAYMGRNALANQDSSWRCMHALSLNCPCLHTQQVSLSSPTQGVVEVLLAAGASPNHRDTVEGCPLLEAAKKGHEHIIDRLVAAGGSMGRSPAIAARLCAAVVMGDLQLLRCMLRAGADPLSADYDLRTGRLGYVHHADQGACAWSCLLAQPQGCTKQPSTTPCSRWQLDLLVHACCVQRRTWRQQRAGQMRSSSCSKPLQQQQLLHPLRGLQPQPCHLTLKVPKG